MKELEKILSNK